MLVRMFSFYELFDPVWFIIRREWLLPLFYLLFHLCFIQIKNKGYGDDSGMIQGEIFLVPL